MTPSKQAKIIGLKSLQEASDLSGTPISTLNDWFKDRPTLFITVLLGCLLRSEEDIQNCTSCNSDFIAEDHNDRDDGWFCDKCSIDCDSN